MIIIIVDCPSSVAVQTVKEAIEICQRGIVIVGSSEQITLESEPFETYLFRNFYQDIEILQRDIYEYIDFCRPAYPNVQWSMGIELSKVSNMPMYNPSTPTRGTP
jgi:hypothetical protein